MGKDIVTLIKEMNRKTRSKLVSLIECRDDIQKGLDAGCSLLEIWMVLKNTGRISYTYNGFRRAIHKHILHSDAQKNDPAKRAGGEAPISSPVAPESPKRYVVTKRPVVEKDVKDGPDNDVGDDDDGISPSVKAGLEGLKRKGHAFSPEDGYWGKNVNSERGENNR